MPTEAQRIATLAARVARQRRVAIALVIIALVVASGALSASALPSLWRWTIGLGFALFCAWLLHKRRHNTAATALDYTRHLDAALPALQDSSELLLRDPAKLSGLTALAREHAAAQFVELDESGAVDATLPDFPWPPAAAAFGVATIVVLTSSLWQPTAPAANVASDSTQRIQITAATVTQVPPEYLGLAQNESSRLDFTTVENAQIRWDLELSERVTRVALKFHDGELLDLSAARGRRWTSPVWTARSSVYQVMVDARDTPIGVHRIDAQVDHAPVIEVRSPDISLQTIEPASDSAQLTLQFTAHDDHQIDSAVAKVTLARGSGEQVRFREQDLALNVAYSDQRQRASVDQIIDLKALGMTPGDELYLFAQVTDNEPGEPNVGTSGTFIVRWLGEQTRSVDPQATLAVAVLPEFFRSQRQIIIDTEKLLRDRPTLDESAFAQRAQSLAVDQKLLRLRYGQYLGEEDDSGIGAAAGRPAPDEDDPDEGADEHDHAGHDPARQSAATPVSGDADAAIALYAHFHDRAEQSTLFDQATSEQLRAALSNMWDAELQLRLAQPQPALPFEYAALEHIKAVQQGSRIYLRRVGFRPTPVDETRRLTAKLDDILQRQVEHSLATAGEQQQMRDLTSELTHVTPDVARVRTTLAALLPSIRKRAARETSWLPLLGALQRFEADPQCVDCRTQLVAMLWRSLDSTLAAPGTEAPAPQPLLEAYRLRQSAAPPP